MKRLLLIVLAWFVTFNLQAQNPPKRELRGVWISTHLSLDWPNRTQTPAQQQTALLAILNHNKATGMNAAYFQVRSQSDAMYPSTLEPWSYYLTNNQGTPPSPLWDPLQFAIDETHKRGIEFHAWINPYRAVANNANAGNPAQYAATHVSRAHPEWMLTVGAVQILNPGLPEVRDHVTNVIVDIVRRYDVDGIHFDDYFYPNGTSGDDAAYNADPRGFPATTAGRADWRRDNVNMLIQRVGDSINAIKPWVKFGVSPSGIYRSSTNPSIGSPTSAGALQHYSALFADTKKWIQSGWVDYLTPQVYWYIGQTGSDYKLLVPWWNDNSFGRHIYIGLADYKVNTAGWTSRSQIPDQVRLNRSQPNVYGQTHFRHAFLVANALNYRDSLKSRLYNRPALMPAMPWKDNVPAAAPSALTAVTNPDNSVLLAWNKPDAALSEMDKAKRFAIYRSQQKDMDLEDANNLLAITDTDEGSFTDNTVPAGTFYYYSVTSLDRLQNESTRTNTVSNDQIKPIVITQNISRTLANGSVTITADEIDNGSSDNWGVQTLSLSKTSFDCSDIGENSVMLTVIDKAGNVDSAKATITVIGTVPEPAIIVSRDDNTYTGLAQSTIALGYGAQTLILTASNLNQGSGNTSYAWATADGLSSNNTAITEFTPTIPGTYTFVVEAKNEFGCTASTSVVVTVIDVRCDNNKVIVCRKTASSTHPSNQLCISKGSVSDHLQNGGRLGTCDQEAVSAPLNTSDRSEETGTSVLRAYPNPFSTQLNVTFTLPVAERRVVLEIYDLAGNRLKRIYAGNTEANKSYNFPVDASDFQGTIFNVRLVTKSEAYNFKIVKE